MYHTTNLARYKITDAEEEGEKTTPIRGPDSLAHSPDYAYVSYLKQKQLSKAKTADFQRMQDLADLCRAVQGPRTKEYVIHAFSKQMTDLRLN